MTDPYLNNNNALWHLEHYKGPWGVAVDIGAYVGEFSIAAARKGAKVFAYEASPGNYHLLLNNPEFHENITAYNMAVVGNPHREWASIGIGPTNKVRVFEEKFEPVDCITLMEVIKRHAPIDFLKIDIEGGEHEIFTNHYEELMTLFPRVRFIQLEIHPIDGSNSQSENYPEVMDEYIELMRACGFMDEPCPMQLDHKGDFCSHNHNFNGGR